MASGREFGWIPESVPLHAREEEYRVSIKSYPDYKYLLQENYV